MRALVARGHSNTRPRRAVLEALCRARGPRNPTELLEDGRQNYRPLGSVTVYRTLEILQSAGLLRKLHLEDGCHSYVLSLAGLQEDATHSGQAHDHGHHVICDICGRAVEFAGCDVEAVVAVVEAQTGFEVRQHWLEMFGLCPQCRTQNGA